MTNTQKYGGKWIIFESKTIYEGQLHIDFENRVIALEIIIPASKDNPMPQISYQGKIPYICGTLFSGGKIFLYDCSIENPSIQFNQYTQQVIYAKYAFEGLSIGSIEEMKFNKAIFDFGNIIAWSGLCNYKWDFKGIKGSNLMWNHKEPIKFKLNENTEIIFSPKQDKTVIGDIFEKEVKVKQCILTEFIYNKPTSWKTIIDNALYIQQLIGLGTNQKIEIDSIEYCHSSIYIKLPRKNEGEKRIQRPCNVFLGTGKVKATENTHPYECLYTLTNIKENNIFFKWRENYSKLKPILDLYFTAFSDKTGTAEMLFLNLTQALETYHSRFITNNVKKYLKRVDDVVDSFCPKPNKNNTQLKMFLADKGQRTNKSIYLKSRLADLFFAEGNLPLKMDKLSAYISKIVDTRNYYTHYDPTKLDKAFTKEELPLVNSYLLTLLQYHLLILIGFDINEVQKKIAEKTGVLDRESYIQKHM